MENVSILMVPESRENAKGESQIYLMTVDGKRRELSLSKYRPESWDQNKQRGQLRGNHQVKQNACVGRIYLAEQELVNGHIK
jgi:hypothetical protein